MGVAPSPRTTACWPPPACGQKPAAGSQLDPTSDASGARVKWRSPSMTVPIRCDPQVLDLLAKHGVQATFFCVGSESSAMPTLPGRSSSAATPSKITVIGTAQFLVAGPRGMRDEIVGRRTASRGSRQHSALLPRACRPAQSLSGSGARKLALRLASWTRRGFDTINGNADVVYRRLVRSLGGGTLFSCMMATPHSAPRVDGDSRRAAAPARALRAVRLSPSRCAPPCNEALAPRELHGDELHRAR